MELVSRADIRNIEIKGSMKPKRMMQLLPRSCCARLRSAYAMPRNNKAHPGRMG